MLHKTSRLTLLCLLLIFAFTSHGGALAAPATGAETSPDDSPSSFGSGNHNIVPEDFDVPAFSTTGWSSPGYVGLDALAPDELVIIEEDQPTNVFAATFIGNDFERHYGLASSGGNLDEDTFGWIDTDTGEFTEVGIVDGGPGETWTSLAWDYTSRTLYAMAVDALYIIDPDELTATQVGPIEIDGMDDDPVVISIASAADGRMFGIEIVENQFIEIDPDTAEAEVIGDLDLDPSFAQDMDFDHRDNTLYWAAYFGGGNSEIRVIDIDTAESTSLGDVDEGTELLSFTLAVPAEVPMVSIDPESFSVQLDPDDTTQETLEISNFSEDDVLEWSFTPDSEITTPPPSPQGVSVPAFSTTGWSSPGYVGLDANFPDELVIINEDQPTSAFAAAFIGNDFERHYMLATDGGDLEQDTFGWTDTETGEFTEIGIVDGGPGETWTSMAWDYTSETLYAMAVDALYIIDPEGLTATAVGSIEIDGMDDDPVVISIASAADGRMFGIEIVENQFIEIDPGTAEAEVIGDLDHDPSFAQDMDFDHRDNTLYWAAYFGGGNSEIRVIDIDTAESTSLGDVYEGTELLSFTLAVEWAPICQLPDDIGWLEVDEVSGNIEPGDSQIVTLNFDAAGLGAGLYQANLCLETSDPDNELVEIPVQLTVAGPDELFRDRFEQD